MELFKYLIVILIISLIILIVYFNDKIKTAFFDYYIEPFAVAQGTGEKIGLKWLYLGNSEPNGDKITNEKLYILLNYIRDSDKSYAKSFLKDFIHPQFYKVQPVLF